ncbi:OsmC family protein [Candidatus Thiomargarita nelsonii]|uniref:OsmC family protein n=1 Tax=Candidatus Thiomargarita nelsonii TaxID=1003181 RepID=A0A176S4G0_9GAMM|nr:OsmC family protein [Candidatus Thiomargarita nelsonii]
MLVMATMKKLEIGAKLVDNFKFESHIRNHQFIIDQPPKAGGKDEGPSPLEYLCLSLAACVVTVGQIMAKQKRIKLRNIEAKVEAEVDSDVFMGKGQEHRAGFLGFKILTKIDADMSLEEKKAFLKELDSRCPISENLQHTTPVTLEVDEYFFLSI